VAALASWLDARAHGGRWLVRIEDVDTQRCVAGADNIILSQLAACGLLPDQAPVWQSRRSGHYQAALDELVASGKAYPCACSRKDTLEALTALGRPHQRNTELIYPGTCRGGLRGRMARAWRFRTDTGAGPLHWQDRRLGPQRQDMAQAVGDFVLRRADGCSAYQLAVVVDDAAQGISHVVRGEDLADNTARQVLLQRALDLRLPVYLHTPLVLGANGEKLSKQNGAAPLQLAEPLAALNAAADTLGLSAQSGATQSALAAWVLQWRDFYNRPCD